MCIAIIQLDLLRTGGDGLTRGSSLYIFVLHSVLLIMALAVDYLKQKPLCRRIREIADIPEPLQRVPLLPEGQTAEQRLVGEFAHLAYSQHTSEVMARDERSQLHILSMIRAILWHMTPGCKSTLGLRLKYACLCLFLCLWRPSFFWQQGQCSTSDPS